MQQQLGSIRHKPKADSFQWAAEGGWAHADQLMEFVDSITDWADGWWATLPAVIPNHRQPNVQGCYRALMMALLACFCWGYHPPMRPGLLRSIQHPDYTKCQLEGCQFKGCKGNRCAGFHACEKRKTLGNTRTMASSKVCTACS